MKKTLLFMFIVMCFTTSMVAQRTVNGLVTDVGGEPLIGASVVVSDDASIGTITDIDGTFSLEVPSDATSLEVSYTGYTTKTIDITSGTNFDVQLSEGEALDEVIVTAYGTEDRKTVTSAVTFVDVDDFDQRSNASFAQALQSLAPGLNISTANGQPGGNSLILLRGINSISGNIEPLFVIDGVPVDEDNFRTLNQADIASITVLKDAAATAIYGNRATGGVIVVKTKQGKFDGGTTIKYTTNIGYTDAFKPNFEMASTKQILEVERAAGTGVGGGRANPYVAEQLGIERGTPLTDEQIATISGKYNTNWNDILTRKGRTNNHNLSFTFGNDKIANYSSLGYLDQQGITQRSSIKRYTFRNNTTFRLKKLSFYNNLTLGVSTSNFPGGIGGRGTSSGSLSNPFLTPYVSKPYLNPYNEDGSLNVWGDTAFSRAAGFYNTPYLSQNVAKFDKNDEKEMKVIGGLGVDYKILDNLTAGVSAGMDYTNISTLGLLPSNSIRGARANDENAQFQGSQREGQSKDARFNALASLRYNTSFDEVHNFGAAIYSEYIFAKRSGFSYSTTGLIPGLEGTGAGFVSGNTTEDPNGDGRPDYFYIPSAGSFNQKLKNFSYFGKLTYDYDEYAGFDFTMRRDASSRFSKANRWGTFWAVGAFWNVGKSLIKDSDVFSSLKLRASYGITGNDRVVDAYYGGLVLPFDLFNTGTGYNATVGLNPSQIGNPDLKWEETAKANIGLDFRMFKNRMSGTIEVFRNQTYDLFIPRPNTLVSGFGEIRDNVGTLENRGVELSLSYKVVDNEDMLVEVGANSSYIKNEITALAGSNPNKYGEDILDSRNRTVIAVGHPIYSFYAVRWAGVNPATGKPLYLDREGNVTETYDLNNRVFVNKSTMPDFQGGFWGNIAYKGFTVGANFNYVTGAWRYNNALGVIEDPNLIGIANVSTTMTKAWKKEGDVTSIPSYKSGSTRNLRSDRYLEDASYLRLKSLSVGYRFDKSLLRKTFLSSAKIYLQGENLLTWTKWRGYDPEFSPLVSQDFFSYPNSKIYTLGLSVEF